MYSRKELFSIWAPKDGFVWTRYAKPALFVHAEHVRAKSVTVANIPSEIKQFSDGKTAIIADLPGDESILVGLGLIKNGYRPVPLFNGIHETNTGRLSSIIDNTPIINALVGGANIVESAIIANDAPPVFLLDSNRNKEVSETENSFDNQWSVDFDDLPNVEYMRRQGIRKILIWTSGKVNDDLIPILQAYESVGIEAVIYDVSQNVNNAPIAFLPIDVRKRAHNNQFNSNNSQAEVPVVSTKTREAVRKFENARIALLLVVIVAIINLVGMFFINEEPLIWTTPSIMWMTYLWISELSGDIIALTSTLIFFLLFLFSAKKHALFVIAFMFFLIDVIVFSVYAINYGIPAFTGYSVLYGLLVFGLPLVFLIFLIEGMVGYKVVAKLSAEEYQLALDSIDGISSVGFRRRRRRFFRPYRGFRGYGGTGRWVSW
ncbi:MAG: hypothetical protein FWE36_07835 [Erysipelotrichales bacterium]|nr:hypothetical protein [Erysipelotrichales bacterium]